MDQQPKKKERNCGRKASQAQDRHDGIPPVPAMTRAELRDMLAKDATFHSIVLRAFAKKVGQEHAADDLQKVCTRLTRHAQTRPNYRIAKPAAYLYKAARNARIDRARTPALQDDEHRKCLQWQTEAADRHRWAADDPAEQASRNEENDQLRAAMKAALAELSPDERELFLGRERDGKSYKQLADEFGRTPGALRKKLHKIRKRLQESEALRRYRDAAA
jgi:RNA polymerase sigma factor (sigma-70 family)